MKPVDHLPAAVARSTHMVVEIMGEPNLDELAFLHSVLAQTLLDDRRNRCWWSTVRSLLIVLRRLFSQIFLKPQGSIEPLKILKILLKELTDC